jgi:hypothetical protein
MKNKLSLKLFIALLSCIQFATVNAQQTYYYDFRNTLSEKGGIGPALNALSSGSYVEESLPNLSCLERTVYSFPANSGVQFDNGAAGNFIGNDYSVEMYFKFSTSNGFFRIMDYKNQTSDLGLYATNTELQFYDELTVNTIAFATPDYVHLVLTRNGVSNLVSIYLNGSLIGSFTDSGNKAVLDGSNVLNFFQDDLIFGGEAQPGTIAMLKLYDQEINATEVSNNFQNLETTSGTVAFSSDILSACLSNNLFNFTNESENSAGVTYSWDFGDGGSASTTDASHTYVVDGNFTVTLTADDGNGCTDDVSLAVVVGLSSTPIITPSGPVDLCSGQTVTLTSTAGASYLWSDGQTTQSIVVSVAGDYSVTVDDGNGCTGTSAITTVTKYAAIPGGINNFVGSTIACPGQSLVYSVNPVLRAVYYIWTMPANATSNGQAVYQTTSNSITVDFGAGFLTSGSLQVQVYNGCGVRGPSSKIITNSPPSTPASISGPDVACENTTQTYSTALVAGIDTYTWSAPAGGIIVSGQGTNQVDITFPAGYVAGYVRVVNTNQCGSSNQRSLYVRATPPRPGTIVGPVSGLCSSTQTYTVSATVGASSYTWTAPTGSSVTSGQGTNTCTIAFNAGLNTGFVKVTASNVCGTSGIQRLAVKGGVEIDTEPIDVGTCSGGSASFTVSAFGSNLIYKWRKNGIDLVASGTVTGVNTATLNINPVALIDAGTYDCIVRRACGTADTSLGAVLTPDAGPTTPGAVTGAGVACTGDAGVPYSFVPVAGATSYNWSGDAGVTIASGQGTNAVTVDFGVTPLSGYSLFVTAVNACGESDTATYWVRNKVSVPNYTAGPTTICSGTNGVVYSVAAVGGATSYNWTVPANATIASGQGTTSITVDFGPAFTSGQVCVTASNLCFTSTSRCRTVTSTPTSPGNIQGVAINVCNTSQNYSINAIANATSYVWTAPTGATVSSGQGTTAVTVDFGPTFVSGDLQVVSQNTCGNSAVRSRLIQAFPAKPAQVFGNASPCVNSTGNVYSVDPIPGATSYTWTVPPGSTITAGAGTTSITVSFGNISGQLTAAAVNACGTGFSKGLAIAFGCRIMNDAVESNIISVYPNPAKDVLNVELKSTINEKVVVRVTDVSGRLLISKEVYSTEATTFITLNIDQLKAGYYFIETKTAGSNAVNRFVKD